MSDGKVLGKDCHLFAYDESAAEWVAFACFRSATFTVGTDFIEVSIRGSGNNRDFEPTANNFTANMEGIMDIYKENHYSIADLRAFQMDHTKILCRFERVSRDLHYYTSECYMFVSNSTDTFSFDNVATFTADFRGTGAITDIFTPTPIVGAITYSMYYPSNGTYETEMQDDALIGKTVIGAWKVAGTDYQVITAGTVMVTEIKHDTITGTMSWVIPMEPDEVWHFQYR